jgi:hypothetical protein
MLSEWDAQTMSIQASTRLYSSKVSHFPTPIGLKADIKVTVCPPLDIRVAMPTQIEG